MNGTRSTQTRHRRYRPVAARAARIPAKPGMCGTLTARCKAATQRTGDAEHECATQWRHLPDTETDARAWLVRSADIERRHRRTGNVRSAVQNAPGQPPRLLAVGLHPVSTRLRPVETRRTAGRVQYIRLDAGWRTCKAADHGQPSSLETCPQRCGNGSAQGGKNKNGSPATGRSFRKRPTPGRTQPIETSEIGHFVPPRDKTPVFE